MLKPQYHASHHHFSAPVMQVNDYLEEGTPADRHLRKIAIHVSAYITHIRVQLKQTIPKAIVHTLVCTPCICP